MDDLFDSPPAATGARKVYRVADLTRMVKATLEDEFPDLWVEGEVSNLRRPASGHLYFTLKDEQAQVAVVLFRGDQARGLTVELRDGLNVQVCGGLTVYEKQGQYQLRARRVVEAGLGALQAAFEALKRKLAAEGLFDAARKRPLPLLPQHVGVVTSASGAALRDILTVLGRRFPNLHVVVAPVRVQGGGAAAEIAAAIDLLNRLTCVEVMIVGRGGGSVEDLWAFNEEVVARAIARSAIPVISAVGHETDFTIADFVADLRAPTPSAAAELVVGRKEAFEERLAGLGAALRRALRERALEERTRLLALAGNPVFRRPGHLVDRQRDRLAAWGVALSHSARDRLRQEAQRLDEGRLRLGHGVRLRLAAASQDLRRLGAQVKALSPAGVLARGFSITRLAGGRVLRDAAEASVGTRLETFLHRGTVESAVTRATPSDTAKETP